MKQIRRNVFETNSSSTHSFSHSSERTYNNLVPDSDGFLYIDLLEFGWGPFTCYDSESKLVYLLLVAAYCTDHSFWYYETSWNEEWDSFQATDLFQDIQKAVCEYLNCEGIIINEGSQGYIDHQSLPYGSDFYSWLKEETGVDNITDFIFGDVVMHIDNDNH